MVRFGIISIKAGVKDNEGWDTQAVRLIGKFGYSDKQELYHSLNRIHNYNLHTQISKNTTRITSQQQQVLTHANFIRLAYHLKHKDERTEWQLRS